MPFYLLQVGPDIYTPPMWLIAAVVIVLILGIAAGIWKMLHR